MTLETVQRLQKRNRIYEFRISASQAQAPHNNTLSSHKYVYVLHTMCRTLSKTMRFNFIASLVAVATLCQSAAAFPNGAGGCSVGIAAVQGSHLTNPTTGSLADGGLSISLGGVTLAAGSTTAFPVNTDTVITVSSTTKSFKGFLLRLGETGGVTTDNAWSFAGLDIQKAFACFDVGGVTHTSNNVKTSISATLRLPTAATAMPLDVTIVIQNVGGSEYYYSQYLLTAVDAIATFAPVLPVTPAPIAVTIPTAFPTAVPPTGFPTVQSNPVSASTPFPTGVPPTGFPTVVVPPAVPTVQSSPILAPTAFPTAAAPTGFPTAAAPTRFPTAAAPTAFPTVTSPSLLELLLQS
jgi:hypothetical protein